MAMKGFCWQDVNNTNKSCLDTVMQLLYLQTLDCVILGMLKVFKDFQQIKKQIKGIMF